MGNTAQTPKGETAAVTYRRAHLIGGIRSGQTIPVVSLMPRLMTPEGEEYLRSEIVSSQHDPEYEAFYHLVHAAS